MFHCILSDPYLDKPNQNRSQDVQNRPKHVVVSITVTKYTSEIKLCLTTYLFLVMRRLTTGIRSKNLSLGDFVVVRTS